MTADQRFDQLEPLVSQTLAVADRHTAQLRQLVNLVTQQSDNIQFVLKELDAVKEKQTATDVAIETINSTVEALSSSIEVVNFTLNTVNSRVESVDTKWTSCSGCLAAISSRSARRHGQIQAP